MFKCDNCHKSVPQKSNKVVITRREKTYENFYLWGRREGEIFNSYGWEIKKEITCCSDCYTLLTGEKAQIKVASPKIENKKPSESNWKYKKNRDNKIPIVETIKSFKQKK